MQGVFYRASSRDQAIQLGLSGWVRNLASGGVELIACGEILKIEKLKEWLWQGPVFAKVTEVNAEQLTENQYPDVKGFEVLRDG